MAEQIDIDLLVDQLRQLIPALKATSSTPTTTRSSGIDKSADKIVNAIAKLAASLDAKNKTETQQKVSTAKFIKEIDDAAESLEKLTKQQADSEKEAEKLAQEHKKQQEAQNETIRRAILTQEQRNKEDKEALKKSKITTASQALEQKRQAQYNKKGANSANELIDEYSRGVTGTAALREKFVGLGGTSVGLNVGLQLATAGIEGFGKALTQYASAIYDGEQGAAVAAKSIETFADTVGTAAQAIGGILLVIPGFQLLGAGLIAAGTAAKGLAKANTLAAEMSDRLYGTYQDLSKSGVTAADGMTGLSESAQKLGYGLDKIGLAQFTQLLANSSKDLALLSGSAVQGRKDFSNLSESIVKGDTGRQLMNMGMNVNDINEGTAAYIAQQTSLGRAQSKTFKELQTGAVEYVKEMDVMSKLTGMQRKELESQMDANRRNERFRFAIEKVRAEQGEEAARNLEANMAVASARFPELAEGLKDISAGYVNTEAAAKVFRAGMQDVPQQMTKGLGSGFKELGQAAKQTSEQFGSLAGYGSYGDTFGNYYETLKAAGLAEQDAVAAAKAMAEQQANQAKGTDAATSAQTDLRREQMNTRDSLQGLVNLGVKPATSAMTSFSGAVNSVTDFLLGKLPKQKQDVGRPPADATSPSSTASPGKFSKPGQTSPQTSPQASPQTSPQTSPQASPSYTAKLIQAESGGRNIANRSGQGGTATTTAFGLTQFTKGTFEGLAKKAGRDNPLYGKTWEDYKVDTNLQMEATKQLTDKNRTYLASKGLSTTDSALYLAHFLGPGGARKALSASDSDPIQSVVSPEQYDANPMLQKMNTVGDLKAWADKKMGGVGYANGGIIQSRPGGSKIIAGEGKFNEAIVPLPDGKSIPVSFNNIADSIPKFSEIQQIFEKVTGPNFNNLSGPTLDHKTVVKQMQDMATAAMSFGNTTKAETSTNRIDSTVTDSMNKQIQVLSDSVNRLDQMLDLMRQQNRISEQVLRNSNA